MRRALDSAISAEVSHSVGPVPLVVPSFFRCIATDIPTTFNRKNLRPIFAYKLPTLVLMSESFSHLGKYVIKRRSSLESILWELRMMMDEMMEVTSTEYLGCPFVIDGMCFHH